ncbi:SDR family oxidoreductase [Aminobacter aganoensis]|uniref:SDR family oxidoreductase n=1 Tax=Aminobacter TaxID=31988 RepID=UPI0006F7B697|nr:MULTISPECIES: SDR family oxidoreductase [Aminobacter]KQU76278.1 oxidoreductase [Aminobacter sp. DSM 101952]
MRVLILGGNGFIGAEVARSLAARGLSVTALARDTATAARRHQGIQWVKADLAHFLRPEDWRPLLKEIDAVVNCAGALQDGPRDNVAAVQFDAMSALYGAAAPSLRIFVQVSARTDDVATDTPFFATKRRADAALRASGLPFAILRPAVVIGRTAHGGSALLRALAAFPVITPLVFGQSRMQFVSLDDVTDAVFDALSGDIAPGSDIDLASDQTLSLAEAVAVHRRWLGLTETRTVRLPGLFARLTAHIADLLGRLGWRSPLRSTALEVAAGGISGHARDSGRRLLTLAAALDLYPAGVQDLWFARLYLLKPAMFATLSLFWLLSGIIALLRFDVSAAHLVSAGATPTLAAIATVGTSLADIALGMGVAIRRHARAALIGMVTVSLGYLAAATVLAPSLWADPLGPLVKVLPSIALTLAALAILEER